MMLPAMPQGPKGDALVQIITDKAQIALRVFAQAGIDFRFSATADKISTADLLCDLADAASGAWQSLGDDDRPLRLTAAMCVLRNIAHLHATLHDNQADSLAAMHERVSEIMLTSIALGQVLCWTDFIERGWVDELAAAQRAKEAQRVGGKRSAAIRAQWHDFAFASMAAELHRVESAKLARGLAVERTKKRFANPKISEDALKKAVERDPTRFEIVKRAVADAEQGRDHENPVLMALIREALADTSTTVAK